MTAQSMARRGTAWAAGRSIALLLFVAGFLSTVPYFHNGRFGPGYEPVAVARSLVEGHGFANPFASVATGPTAHTAPVFPLFLALLLRLFGYTGAFVFAASFACAIMHGLQAALLPAVSDLFFRDRRPGVFAAFVLILLPVVEFVPQFETIYAVVGTMLFYLAAGRLARRRSLAGALLIGGFCGLVALLQPTTVCITIPWIVWLLFRHRIDHRKRFLLYAAIGMLVALAPWTWRNYRQFHSFFFIRDNLGTELFVSNNDVADPNISLNTVAKAQHPDQNKAEALAILQLGEVEYNHRKMQSALEWIGNNRSDFFHLTRQRIRLFWLTGAQLTWLQAYSVAFVSFTSLLGFVIMAVRREHVLFPIVMVFLLYPLVYYFIQVDHRYREPILWISLLGTGYLITVVALRVSLLERSDSGPELRLGALR